MSRDDLTKWSVDSAEALSLAEQSDERNGERLAHYWHASLRPAAVAFARQARLRYKQERRPTLDISPRLESSMRRHPLYCGSVEADRGDSALANRTLAIWIDSARVWRRLLSEPERAARLFGACRDPETIDLDKLCVTCPMKYQAQGDGHWARRGTDQLNRGRTLSPAELAFRNRIAGVGNAGRKHPPPPCGR